MGKLIFAFQDGGVNLQADKILTANIIEAISLLASEAKKHGAPKRLILTAAIVGVEDNLFSMFAEQSTSIGGGVSISKDLEKILKNLKG